MTSSNVLDASAYAEATADRRCWALDARKKACLQGGCWGGCSACYGGCIDCWCQPYLCGDCEECIDCSCQCLVFAGAVLYPVGCVGYQMLFGVVPQECCDEVEWSGGDDPHSDGCMFNTHWDTPGVNTVTACIPCGCDLVDVTILKVGKVVEAGTDNEGPLYVCLNGSVWLEPKSYPPGNEWLCNLNWSIVSKPPDSNPSLTPFDLISTPCGYTLRKATLSGLDKVGDYVVKATSGCNGHECSGDTITVTVVEVKSLLPDVGEEFDDGDGNPNTKSFVVCVVDPNYDPNIVTVTATPNPNVSEEDLPDCWTLEGGTGTSKLFRTVDRTTPGVTTIKCTCSPSSKTTKIYVVKVEITALGFKSDHMIRKWPSGIKIDYPDGNTPVWKKTSNPNDPVCYTKNTPPTMFAVFNVTPSISPDITGVQVRAKVGGVVIGSASGCKISGTVIEDSSNTDGDVDGISGGSAVPNSNGVKTLTPTFIWEVSFDGTIWCSDSNSGPHTMYWTNATPAALPLLYDLGLQKACGYVNGAADIGNKINIGVDSNIYYDPRYERSHNLNIFSQGSGQCCCHAAVFSLLVSHVTNTIPASVYTWGGCSSSHICYYKYSGWWGPSFKCDRPTHDYPESNPHFTFHVEASYDGVMYDPSYGMTGWPSLIELAPVVPGNHTAAATQQTGSGLPTTAHYVNWMCPCP